MCRKKVTKMPIKNRAIDNIIDKLEQKLPPEEQELRKQKKLAREQKEESDVKKLNMLIENAVRSGQRFLKVTDRWTPKEKEVFIKGVK